MFCCWLLIPVAPFFTVLPLFCCITFGEPSELMQIPSTISREHQYLYNWHCPNLSGAVQHSVLWCCGRAQADLHLWCNCFYVFVVLEIGPQRNSHISCFFILLRSKFFSTGTSETQMCQGETESDLREILTFLSAACLEQFWGENLPGRKYVWNYGMMAPQPWHNHGNHPFQL